MNALIYIINSNPAKQLYKLKLYNANASDSKHAWLINTPDIYSALRSREPGLVSDSLRLLTLVVKKMLEEEER